MKCYDLVDVFFYCLIWSGVFGLILFPIISISTTSFITDSYKQCSQGKTFECGTFYNRSKSRHEKKLMLDAYKVKTGKDLIKEMGK